MTLKQLEIGKSAVISRVGGEGALRQHFLDMGVIPGAEVTVVKYAPMGDPIELLIHGYELTLRLADADQIEVEPIDAKSWKSEQQLSEKRSQKEKSSEKNAKAVKLSGSNRNSEHPGLGEGGKFHPKGSGDPLPDGTTLTFALVGNQNSGKTTLFNRLTGANQREIYI